MREQTQPSTKRNARRNHLLRAYVQARPHPAAAVPSSKRATLRPAVVMRALLRRLAPHRLSAATTVAIIISSRADQGDQGDDAAGEAEGAKEEVQADLSA